MFVEGEKVALPRKNGRKLILQVLDMLFFEKMHKNSQFVFLQIFPNRSRQGHRLSVDDHLDVMIHQACSADSSRGECLSEKPWPTSPTKYHPEGVVKIGIMRFIVDTLSF